MSFRKSSARASSGYQDDGAVDQSDQPSSSHRRISGSRQDGELPAEVTMELLVEKLKLMQYEKHFCRKKNSYLKPLSRMFFALPAPTTGQNEQFFYFTSLVAWLLSLAGRKFATPQQFDDPNVTCTSIITEVKEAGVAVSAYAPTKLRQGYGDAVCSILNGLADLALEKQKFQWRAPVRLPDNYVEEAEVQEDADVMDADIADEVGGACSSDDDTYMERQGVDELAGPEGEGQATTSNLESKVDPAEWRLELERVAPRLKLSGAAEAKDWRAHLEQAHHHQRRILELLPDTQSTLKRVQADVGSALDRVDARETFLNSQLSHLTHEYRAAREQLAHSQAAYSREQDAVAALDNELAHVTKELEDRKRELDERGSSISDTTPVVNIKAAIKSLKGELRDMSVRTGVLQHQLLQISLRKPDSLPASGLIPGPEPSYDSS